MRSEDMAALVATASPLRLVVLNYELAMRKIHAAKEAGEGSDEAAFAAHVREARAFVMLLAESLDMTFEISAQLLQLYLYCDGVLARAVIRQEPPGVCEACDVLGSLLDAWRSLAREEKNTAPVMENADALVAGMTYNGRALAELVLGGETRGFWA